MPPPVPPPGFTIQSTAPRPPAPPPGFAISSSGVAAPQPPPGFSLTDQQPAPAPESLLERASLVGIDPAIYSRATDFGRTVYDSTLSPPYDRDWLVGQMARPSSGPPPPPPGFEISKPPGWIDVEPEEPLGFGDVLGDSLGQTASEWGDVFAGLPTKVSASLAKTIASMQASNFAELEQANAAAAALPEGDWRRMFLTPGQGTPEKAAELRALTEGEQAIAGEANADLAPTEGATMLQSALESAAISAPPSAVAMATGILTRNPVAAAASMYPTTAAQGFGDMLSELDARAEQQERETLTPRTDADRLEDIGRAQRFGEREGTLETFSEILPMGALLKAGTPAVKRLAEVLLAELPGETIAGLTQEINRQIALQPEGEATVDAIFAGLEEGGKQIPETLLASILGSAAQTAPIAAAQAIAAPGKSPPAAPPKIEPTMGDELVDAEPAPDAPIDVEARAGVPPESEVERAAAPGARTPSELWRSDAAAGEGVPFAFLGETPETAAGYMVEEAGKIQAFTAAGDLVGSFDGPDEAAIALEDAVGVQTPTPAQGFGDELTELGGAEVPREATPGQIVEPRGFGDLLPETAKSAKPAAQDRPGDAIEGGAATPGRPETPIAQPAAAQAVTPPERRGSEARRKPVAQMTPEELRQTILTHELTGIPNRRAYEEAPKRGTQTAVDVDSLKWINDNMGHDSGNELLKAVGEAIRSETDDAYHLSGDEFAIQADTPEESAAIMERVNERLAGAVISVTMPSGEVVTVSGLGVSYGSGKNLSEADAALQSHKTERETRGQRAGRGQQPPGASRFATSEGREGDESDAAAGAETQQAGERRADGDQTEGEHVTLAGPFARTDRADVDDVELSDRRDVDRRDLDRRDRERNARTQGREIAIRELLGKAKNAPDFRFVAEGSLPHSVQSRMKVTPGHDWEGVFDPTTNKVYLNQDVLDSEERAAWVAMHEIAGHYGIRGAVGQLGAKNRDAIRKALKLASQNNYIDGLAEAIGIQRTGLSYEQRLEEALSELAAAVRTNNLERLERKYGLPVPKAYTKGDVEQKPAWRRAFDRFVATLQKLLERAFGYKVPDSQVLELIEDAWQYVQSGPRDRTTAHSRKFNKTGEDETVVADKDLALQEEGEAIGDEVERILEGEIQPVKAKFVAMINRVTALIEQLEGLGMDPTVAGLSKRDRIAALTNRDLRDAARTNLEQLLETYADRFGEEYSNPTVDKMLEGLGDAVDRPPATAARELGDPEINRMLEEDGELSESDTPQTSSPAFKKWFGESQVVDGKGKPLVVYHATQADVTTFRPWSHFGDVGAANDRGAHLRAFDGVVGRKSGEWQTMPVYLSIKNPLRMRDMAAQEIEDDSPGSQRDVYTRAWEEAEDVAESLLEMGEISIDEFEEVRGSFSKILLTLEAKGYDGIVYENAVEGVVDDVGHDSWIVFRPGQVKSAVGNRGTFDASNPDIVAEARDREDGGRRRRAARAPRSPALKPGEQGVLFTKDDARPGTTPEQLELANELLREWADKAAKGTKAIKTLAVAFDKDFRSDHTASLLGRDLRNAHDFALLAQTFRDPRYETLRYFFTDKAGKVIAETGVSARLPGGASAWPAGSTEQWLVDMFKRVKADGIRLLHNHPSGSAQWSEADLNITSKIAKVLGVALEHVIVDSNEYSVIRVTAEGNNDRDKGSQSRVKLTELGPDKMLKPRGNRKLRKILGSQIIGPTSMVQIAKQLEVKANYISVIGLSARHEVRAIGDLRISAIKNRRELEQALHDFGLQNGAPALVLAGVRPAMLDSAQNRRDFANLISSGYLLDVVDTNGRSLQEMTVVGRGSLTLGRLEGLDTAEAGSGKPLGIGGRREERRASVPTPPAINRAQIDLFDVQHEIETRLVDPAMTGTSAFKRWFGKSKVVDEQGNPLIVYHGTSSSTDFASFGRTDDVGFHFGTMKAAADRLGLYPESKRKWERKNSRVIPAYLAIKKPLRLPDLFEWDTESVVDALIAAKVLQEADRKRWFPHNNEASMGFETFRDLLERAGYDGVVYSNEAEGIERAPFNFTIDDVDIQKDLRKAHPYVAYAPDTGKYLTSASSEAMALEQVEQMLELGDVVQKDSWIALRPTQIKSAIANKGTFDPDAEEIVLSTTPKDAPDEPRDFRDVKDFDAWIKKQAADGAAQLAGDGVGSIELAAAETTTGLRGAKYQQPADAKVLYRLDDGRLVYWKLGKYSAGRASGQAVFVSRSDPRVTLRDDVQAATAKGGVQKISWKPGQNYVEMYRTKGAPTQRQPATTMGAGTRADVIDIPEEPIRAKHVMDLFQRLFKVKIYEGKPFAVRGALGYFRPSNFEVRNKNRNDLEVAAHEVFHWLDRTYPEIRKLYHLRRYADELKGVSYDTTKIYEGFAEFGRLFMTQETEAITRLPTFYEAFVKAARDNGILDKLEEVQRLMHQWYLQGAEARGRSKIGTSKAPIRQRLGAMADGFVDRAIASSLDQLQAAKVIERETRGAIAADAADSPYKSLRLLQGARSTINAWLNFGTQKWGERGDLEYNGLGLRQIFEPVAGVFDETMGYFVAMRANELRRYGKENLLAKDETAALLERARKTGKLEQIKHAHELYQQFTKRLTSFAVQSGILSAQTKAVWEELYQNYVPFYRVAEKFGSLDPRMAGGTKGGLFRKLYGGTANIADVFENITLNTALIVQASLKNVAKRQLFAAIESSPVGQRYAVRIPTSTELRNVGISQIERVLKEFAKEAEAKAAAGVVDKIEALQMAQLARALAQRSNDLGQATMGDVMQQAKFFFTGNPPTIPDKEMVLVRGEPRWFQIGDPMLWDMLTAINYHQPLGLAEQVFGIAKRALTRGVTVTPEFQFANILRDTFNAFALSKGGQLPVIDAMKALRDIWTESDAYKEFLGNGGGFGNAVGDEAKRLRVQMKATGTRRVIAMPAELLDYWDKWGQSFELATRLAEFKKIREKGGSRREAAFQGREISTDFAMRGHSALARWASISVSFFNARLQGLYRIERELNEKRGRQTVLRGERAIAYAMRGFMGLTTPALLVYWFLNRGDDDYEDLGEELKSLNTVIPGPDGTQILIPRPFETGAIFQEIPIRLLEYYRDRDGDELVDAMMFMLANTFNFNPTPQLVAPPLTIMRNRQWNGLPVVPRNLENVEPREQFQPWTPDTYKRIGEKFNVSPVKLQALVEGYFGTVGGYLVAGSDALMQAPDTAGAEPSRQLSQYPLVRRFMREQPYRNTSFEQQFYDLALEVTTVVDTAAKMRREARVDELEDYLGDNEKAALFAIAPVTEDARQTAADLNAQMRALRQDPELSADEKLEQINELQVDQNALFKDAMEAFDDALLEELARDLGGL